MSNGVEFDEDKIVYERPRNANGNSSRGSTGASGMAGWLIRKGWVKTNSAAQAVLLGIVIIDIILIFVVVHYFL